jgi:hypothetical protein
MGQMSEERKMDLAVGLTCAGDTSTAIVAVN